MNIKTMIFIININDKDHAYIKQEVSDLVKGLEPVM